ncbi:MAG: hypothetical protein A3E07_01695 [Candidatus Wildermuthbacteria bacterium RIFCSPHIGHO2_12_FULL_45_9]|uniref:Uncharacterized protein n=1 Tax=Candidatus Wildermuthbacteria bacterium RIFCSPHIGHO2_02_FULL_45_25 TaxID=1802450 RepID=A0A1G2R4S4_9BACT|nr:MAG: hypothetical protein A2748_01175 [Candidatus Wildermuthbacteria bacterium RIFCSPHIGHO2_01_FULL_45_20]OHA67864.1 MAG: hypothetical protein A3C04_02930 [Candidatus Wildermuthbacteria bacterium RIFCSPHIGHO2_02_FULL_45_25]OHA70202.1 MAG: hypothetical protein A3E07_01695 [Candidatus Wildermuthbacteria bacterium RIFCSPHIGHO2_12_FULL_45_9]
MKSTTGIAIPTEIAARMSNPGLENNASKPSRIKKITVTVMKHVRIIPPLCFTISSGSLVWSIIKPRQKSKPLALLTTL